MLYCAYCVEQCKVEIEMLLYCAYCVEQCKVQIEMLLYCAHCVEQYKFRLRYCYTTAVICLHKVSCVEWIRNVINTDLSKFGYYFVYFIESICQITPRICIYIYIHTHEVIELYKQATLIIQTLNIFVN
jgi:hypothetical protein